MLAPEFRQRHTEYGWIFRTKLQRRSQPSDAPIIKASFLWLWPNHLVGCPRTALLGQTATWNAQIVHVCSIIILLAACKSVNGHEQDVQISNPCCRFNYSTTLCHRVCWCNPLVLLKPISKSNRPAFRRWQGVTLVLPCRMHSAISHLCDVLWCPGAGLPLSSGNPRRSMKIPKVIMAIFGKFWKQITSNHPTG